MEDQAAVVEELIAAGGPDLLRLTARRPGGAGMIVSCLQIAVAFSSARVVRVLLGLPTGMELLREPMAGGESCLHHACRRGFLSLVEVLLEAGGEVANGFIAQPGPDGLDCLALACAGGHAGVVRALLAADGCGALKRPVPAARCLAAATEGGSAEVVRALAADPAFAAAARRAVAAREGHDRAAKV
jgi:hypothetical protein